MPQQPRRLDRKSAELLAIEALNFLAREPERLSRFLALTGIGPSALRAAAREPGFLAAVLDHVCADGPLLAAFAADSGCNASVIESARALLAGPAWERDTA